MAEDLRPSRPAIRVSKPEYDSADFSSRPKVSAPPARPVQSNFRSEPIDNRAIRKSETFSETVKTQTDDDLILQEKEDRQIAKAISSRNKFKKKRSKMTKAQKIEMALKLAIVVFVIASLVVVVCSILFPVEPVINEVYE